MPQLAFHWPMLALGAVLLLFPLPLLFGKNVHYRELDRSWERYLPHVFRLPWHWVDAIRAFAGTWLMMAALGLSPFAAMSHGFRRALDHSESNANLPP